MNQQKKIKIKWKDTSLFSPKRKNIAVSQMETIGYLEQENDSFIIVREPITTNETTKTQHPEKHPTFYLIPKGMITDLSEYV